jgi:hypothetical protein
MTDYVFIDNNNGHFCEYYNFKSNATAEQIKIATQEMKEKKPEYQRCGSKIYDLAEKLLELGFIINLEDNPRNRQYIDRIAIQCISGNY